MFTKVIGTVIVVILLIFGGIYVFFVAQKPETSSTESVSVKEIPTTTETMVSEEGLPGFKGKVLAGEIPYVTEFVKSDYDQVANSDNLVVLYFYANWCPICKEEIPKFYSAFDELSKDSNKYVKVIGFRVNFNDSDTDSDEVELAREHGVAYQHIKVFIKGGQRILKSPETWDKQRYLDEINKVL